MKRFTFEILLFFLSFSLFAQSAGVQFSYNGDRSYYLVERTDLRRYDNGKYTGLINREIRSFISRTPSPNNSKNSDSYYEGSFFVEENTKRSSNDVGAGIHDSIPSAFRITNNGQLFMIEDHGYPSFRSFPSFPISKIKIGEKWISKAERAVDPLYKGIVTKIPMTIEYTYLRDEVFHDEEVFVLSAQWATRYGISYWDFGGDKELKSATGSHKATMYINKRTGSAIVVRDYVDESFIYSNGTKVDFKGTISLFTEYPPALDRSKLIPALQKASLISNKQAQELSKNDTENQGQNSVEDLNKNNINKKPNISDSLNKNDFTSEKNVKVENTEAGIRLTIQNLQFKANSSELLPGETERLNEIASVLKEAPNSQFLVEGHTAKVGYEQGELKLSEERAHVIAEELSKRGISADKFICKGSGGKKPIADNSTTEGKALNRRVEITILE